MGTRSDTMNDKCDECGSDDLKNTADLVKVTQTCRNCGNVMEDV